MMVREPTYRRVVVALDSSRASHAALDASTLLASSLGAELTGLFIEDINQLRMGALPFTRLAGPGPLSRDADARAIERSMRRAAADARASLARLAAARREPVPWSFRVVRGVIGRELGAAAEPADLIVVDESALGRAARAALASVSASVLCLCTSAVGSDEVVVAYGESQSDRRAIDAAARIARATERSLAVLFADEKDEAKIAEVLNGNGVTIHPVRISDRARDFAQAVAERPGAIVVWSGPDEDEDTRKALEPLLDSGRYSVLVAR